MSQQGWLAALLRTQFWASSPCRTSDVSPPVRAQDETAGQKIVTTAEVTEAGRMCSGQARPMS